jgi:lipopolysaccharide transport system permease protein/teichoic acid transport system permease protein
MRSTVPALWDRRHLLGVLVSSQLKRQNRGSLLGYIWWFLDPLMMTAVYYLIIAVLFKRGGSNQPYVLFLVIGLFCFKAFSDSVGQAVTAMQARTSIIRAISFPKAVLPLGGVLANLAYFGFGLVVVVAIAMVYGPQYDTWPSFAYLSLPVVVVVQAAFTAGIALITSVLGVYYTDVRNIVRHILRLWFYLSPGLYSVSLVPERFRDLYMLNPFAGLMESYRAIIMDGELPPMQHLGTAAVVASVTLVAGFLVFLRLEGQIVQKL